MAEEMNKDELTSEVLEEATQQDTTEIVSEGTQELAQVEGTKKASKKKTEEEKKKPKKTPALFRFFIKLGKGIGGLFVRLGHFLKDCKSEMKKISWYGKKQTIHSTLIVLAVMVVAGAVIILLDIGLSWLLNLLASWMPSIQ